MQSSHEQPVWEPHSMSSTNVYQFMKFVSDRHNIDLRTYPELHRWSVGDSTFCDFWRDAYTWLKLAPEGSGEVGPMLTAKGTSGTELFPPQLFFPNDCLNIAELLLRKGKDGDIAIHFVREGVDGTQKLTWGDIRGRVRVIRDAMINTGVGSGDVVAAVVSNSVYAVTLCLATLSIGAVWSSCSPDLGVDAIVDRYEQVNPRLIFADDGYIYAGKLTKLEGRIAKWSQSLSKNGTELRDVIVLPYCNLKVDMSQISRGCKLESFLHRASGASLDFVFLPFSHPAFILYSSGTTGKPKCIIHSAGGVALKVKIDMILQHDIREDDVVFQYTTTSWIMWVLNLINISSGRSMLLYDGSPYYPSPTVLLELAQDIGVSVFGTSPRYLSDLKSHNIVPCKQFNLESLRIVTSTGSVLSKDLYHWFYTTAFPPHAQLVSMSGGTDISGCFVGGTPLLPVYAGEIQAKALGMAVDIFDASKMEPISVEHSGEAGELVCTKPFPSQPLRFHGPQGNAKYKTSYFGRFGTSVWCQGDFIKRHKITGGLNMLGRSDGVLNPSGVRFGSAEIYDVTETFQEVADAICVGQRRDTDKDERVLLFIKMKIDHPFTIDLERRIKHAIQLRHSPRHVPRFMFEIDDIPYTVNGKKCEINVKQVVSGMKIIKSGTVANPDALNLYTKFAYLPFDDGKSSRRAGRLQSLIKI